MSASSKESAVMLRVLRRNVRIAWHCPEIRWQIASYYGWHCLHCVAAIPTLATSAVALALALASEAFSALAKSVWSVTGEVTLSRRRAALTRARAGMSPDAVKRRLGEQPPEITGWVQEDDQ